MVRYIVVLRGQIHDKGHFRGGGPKNRDFLGPEMAKALRVPFGSKKVEIFRAPSPKMARVMDMPLKTTRYKPHIKKQVHW